MGELLAPAIAGGLLLIGTIITVVLTGKTARTNASAEKAPDVMEAWKEADRARANARDWEDLYFTVKNAFKSYGRRMAEKFGEDSASLTLKEHEDLTKRTPSSEPISTHKEN